MGGIGRTLLRVGMVTMVVAVVIGTMPLPVIAEPDARTSAAVSGPVGEKPGKNLCEEGDRAVTAAEAEMIKSLCTPKVPPVDPAPTPLTCEGSVLCMATEAELAAAGFDLAVMRQDDQEALAVITSQPGFRASVQNAAGLESTSGVAATTYYGAWVNFYLYNNTSCSGTVKASNRCGWLYHKYTASSSGSTYTTSYPARAGLQNDVTKDWTPNVGPIPNDHQPVAGGAVTNRYTWGYMNGAYDGYRADTGVTFDPGKWRLDPWLVNKPGTSLAVYERSMFEIHGGRGTHEFWQSGTYGCVRLPQNSITGLKSLWDTRTDNKRSPAYVYVYYP